MDEKNITKLENGQSTATMHITITQEQLVSDYHFTLAEKFLKSMLAEGLITDDELHKISEKNKQKFSPYLSEIMP